MLQTIAIVLDRTVAEQWHVWLIKQVRNLKKYNLTVIYHLDNDPNEVGLVKTLIAVDQKLFQQKNNAKQSARKINPIRLASDVIINSDICLWLSPSNYIGKTKKSCKVIYPVISIGQSVYRDGLNVAIYAYVHKMLPEVYIHIAQDEDRKLVDHATLSTHSFSINRIYEPLMWRVMFMTFRNLLSDRHTPTLTSASSPMSKEAYSIMGLLYQYTITLLRKAIHSKLYNGQWLLLVGKIDSQGTTLHTLYPPQGTFWADPFLITKNEKNYIFYEALDFKEDKGRIEVMKLDHDNHGSQPVVALEEEHHLSYPFLFTYQGIDYMIPESSAAMNICIYKCDEFPGKWAMHKAILTNVKAYDTTLVSYKGKWWMFTCIQPLDSMDENGELHLFYSDQPLSSEWTPHPSNPIIQDSRYARPAGNLFEHDGMLVRPAQDCSFLYGQKIRYRRIDILNIKEYSESDLIDTQLTSEIPEYQRTHTYNSTTSHVVYDALRPVRKANF